MDIYSYHIIDWFKRNQGNDLTMELKSTPDLRLMYTYNVFNRLEFNQVSCHDLNVPGNNKSLIFYSPTFEETRTGMLSFPQRLCLDFVNVEQQQIYQEKRLVIDLDKPPAEFMSDCLPSKYFTKDKIFFEKTGDMKSTILEYDYSGKFLFSYTILYPDFWETHFEFINDSNLIFLYPPEAKLGNLKIRVMKLDKGKAELVKEIKDIVFPNEEREMNKQFYIQNPIKRFNHLILPVLGSGILVDDDLRTEYMTIDLSSKEIVHKVVASDEEGCTYSLNWNNEEIGMTCFIEDEDYVFEQTLFFKMASNNIVKGKCKIKSLKHLARSAVLISFSYDQILESNLPSSLFDYLGFEK